jgi:hypothetical protein
MRMCAHLDIRPRPRRIEECGRGADAQAILDGALGDAGDRMFRTK